MIVVIGSLRLRANEVGFAPYGLVADIARVAAADGSRVEFIGKIGDDPAGDELLLALARIHVGHVATLRDAAHATPVLRAPEAEIDPAAEIDERAPEAGPIEPAIDGPTLEPADVGLALRYLSDVGVIVATHVAPPVVDEAIDAAAWASAPLIVVLERDTDVPPSLPADALAVVAASDDGDSALGDAIGRYAAALDRGDDRAAADAAFVAAGTVPA